MLDSNIELYFDKPKYMKESQISYDILMKYQNYKFVFAFLVDSRTTFHSKYVIESLFKDMHDNYTYGRRSYSLLRKSKTIKKENITIILFDNKANVI